MTRFLPLLLGTLFVAAPALAQTPYSIAWPEDEPIWTLDVLPPTLSSGPNGSGVEVRNVTYNGRSVMKRGGVPILNVKYESGCNCFRDWQDSEVRFIADNPINPSWIAESTPGTVATMCDAAPSNCVDTNGDGEVDSCSDVGSFNGVAVERFEDMLRLTTHLRAGWYRYTMRWEFHRDGTIRPLFGFTSTGSACTQNARWHHAYWRFDFDIDGAEDDFVTEARPNGEVMKLESETTRLWSGTAIDLDTEITQPEESFVTQWQVADRGTGRGYTIKPSAEDLLTPADPETGDPSIDRFAPEDFVVTRYQPGEIDDGAFGCTAKFAEGTSNPIVNGESVAAEDVVLWYRSGVTKPDIDPGFCYESGPVLTPVGDWSPVTSSQPTADERTAQPTGFTLEEAYPNPFDRTTTVRFAVDEAQPVSLTLYDGVGRKVRTLYEGSLSAGVTESIVIDGTLLPSGAYTVRLEGASVSGSTRVVVLK